MNSCRGNYSRAETIRGRKLFEEVRFLRLPPWYWTTNFASHISWQNGFWCLTMFTKHAEKVRKSSFNPSFVLKKLFFGIKKQLNLFLIFKFVCHYRSAFVQKSLFLVYNLKFGFLLCNLTWAKNILLSKKLFYPF